jgi:hypothetical protein
MATHEEKNQLIETDSKVTQMIKVVDKFNEAVIVIF